MNERVVITGYDVMCSLGNNKEEVREGLQKQEVPLMKYGKIADIDEFKNIYVGRVKWGNDRIGSYTDEDKSEKMLNKTFRGALNDSGLNMESAILCRNV